MTEAVEAEESFRLLFEGNPVPMWLFDPETLKFLAVNDAAVNHYGYETESFLKLTLLDMVPQEDRHDVKNAVRTNPSAGGSPSHVWQHVKADGTEIDVLAFWRHTMFCDRPAQLVAIVDVTAKRQAEARIAHMAHHDALSGLPNRVLFHERLDEALLRVRRHAEILAVLYLDLGQFKNVNDTLGHPAGDKLLVAVAERLRTCLRDCDMVARQSWIEPRHSHPGGRRRDGKATRMVARSRLHGDARLFVQPAGSRKRNRGIAAFAPQLPADRRISSQRIELTRKRAGGLFQIAGRPRANLFCFFAGSQFRAASNQNAAFPFIGSSGIRMQPENAKRP